MEIGPKKRILDGKNILPIISLSDFFRSAFQFVSLHLYVFLTLFHSLSFRPSAPSSVSISLSVYLFVSLFHCLFVCHTISLSLFCSSFSHLWLSFGQSCHEVQRIIIHSTTNGLKILTKMFSPDWGPSCWWVLVVSQVNLIHARVDPLGRVRRHSPRPHRLHHDLAIAVAARGNRRLAP